MKKRIWLQILILLFVPITVSADWTNKWTLAVENSTINCGSDESIDDLHSAAFTAECWIRQDNNNSGANSTVIGKGEKWELNYTSTGSFYALVECVTENGSRVVQNAAIADGQWHHYAFTFDLNDGVRKPITFKDGIKTDNGFVHDCNGGIESDASSDLKISTGGYGSMDGSIAWCRVSDSVRYSGATYEVPSRTSPPDVDEHTVSQWNFNDATGIMLADETGINNCTITNGVWEYFNFDNLESNLNSWWNLEEESGARFDSHGGQDLTDNNTVPRSVGAGADTGWAADFTATNYEYLSHADSIVLSTGDGISFTVAGWAYMATITDSVFIAKGDSGNDTEYALGYDDTTNDKFYFAVGSEVSSGTVFADDPNPAVVDTWYHLVGWHDPDNNLLGISVDLNDTTAAYAYGGQDNSDPFYIGRQGDVYTDGRTDSVFLADRYWNSDERAWAYNGGDGRSYDDIPTPIPTPAPTLTPTPLSASVYSDTLPSSRGLGIIEASGTFGDLINFSALAIIGCILLVFLLIRIAPMISRRW